MKKFLIAAAVLATTGGASAKGLDLPVGNCLISIPERQWCGLFTVQPNRRMQYVGGPCRNGQMEVKYRAKSIASRGNTITIDGKYHVDVTWISPLGKTANVTYRYTDDTGEHSGQRTLTCK